MHADDHPIRQMVSWGIPVALATDDPVRVSTTIGKEDDAEAALGFTRTGLLAFTQNAIEAAVVSENRWSSPLDELRGVFHEEQG